MTRKYFRWTEREIEFLKRNYQHGPTWVAARLGRGVKSVQAKMYMLGLATRKLNAWRDEEIEFLVKNYGKLSREEIAKRLGRSYAAVNNKITELGLAINKRHSNTYFREKEGGNVRVGDKVKVKMRCGTGDGRSRVVYVGMVEFMNDRFVTVNTGKYRITVLKADISCGEAVIKAVGE